MSLQVWLPLTKDLRNQGLNGATITNSGATYSSTGGKLGGCYIFDGTDDALNVGNLSTIVDTDFSFACWFYKDEWGSKGYETIFGGSSGFELESKVGATNSPVLKLYNWGGGSCTYELSKWNHIVFTRNTTETKLYLNGELAVTGAAGTIPSHDYFVGAWNSATQQNFKGKMCDVRIYDHCLSEMEIKQLSQGLVLHYPLTDAYIENTTNLNTRVNMNTSTNNVWGGHSTTTTIYDCTDEPVPFNSGNKIEITYPVGSSTGGGTSVNLGINIPVVSSTIYTLSVYLKASDNFNYWHPNFIYYYGDSAGHGIFNITNKEYIGEGWYRIWGTLTTGSSQTNLNPYFYSYPGTNKTYYIGGWQLEQKDHMTPFVSFGTNRNNSIVYDCSGFCNNGSKWAYDTAGEIICINDTPKYKISTYINSANNTTDTASGTQYIYGNCELTTPQYLTVAFWCKPVAGYGSGTGQGQFSLTNYNIGNDAGSDYLAGPMNHRDSIVDINGSTGTHRQVAITFTANEWHHYVIVYDGRYARVYKDGIAGATADMGSTMTLGSMKGAVIGFSKAGGVWRSNKSYYSDFRIYATALSASDVKSLYQNCATIDADGTIHGQIRS